jgi:hypothetical protein
MKPARSFIIALLTACLMVGTAGAVFAQSDAPGDNASPTDQPQPPATQSDQPYSVLIVTGVEMIHDANGAPLDFIRVSGLTSTDGWTNPELLPLTQGMPEDGVLNLVLVAHAPPDSSEPTGFSPIETIFPLDPGHPNYKAIRVYGATNSVTLKTLPGYVKVASAIKDCGTCIGKFFVANGASTPAGAKPDDLVNQADLPNILRVIKPSDGISITETDPNRLTIILGEDGKIVDAVWQ